MAFYPVQKVNCTFSWTQADLRYLATTDGATHDWQPAGQIDLFPALQPSELKPTPDLLERRPNVHLVEVGIAAWFSAELSNIVFDVTGSISFDAFVDDNSNDGSDGDDDDDVDEDENDDDGEEKERPSFPFSMQLKAPAVSTVLPTEHPKTGAAVIASCVVAVDVQRHHDKRVRNLELAFSLVAANEVLHKNVIPASVGLLPYLHDPDVCDCSFLTKGVDAPLLASRVILMRASHIFRSMLSGPWVESTKLATREPILFTSWNAPAMALVFIHIYSGWTPDQPTLPVSTPEDLVDDFACDPSTLDEDAWRHLLQLARYLGLKLLAIAVNRKLMKLLEEQLEELRSMPDEPIDAPRPRTKKRQQSVEPTMTKATAPQL